eukprot:2151419-Alexandrium_andersonii.AAC.1
MRHPRPLPAQRGGQTPRLIATPPVAGGTDAAIGAAGTEAKELEARADPAARAAGAEADIGVKELEAAGAPAAGATEVKASSRQYADSQTARTPLVGRLALARQGRARPARRRPETRAGHRWRCPSPGKGASAPQESPRLVHGRGRRPRHTLRPGLWQVQECVLPAAGLI